MRSHGKYKKSGASSVILIFLLFASPLSAQETETAHYNWTFTSRFTLTGVSEKSEPSGYKVYSALPFTVGLRYLCCSPLAAELIVSNESREVDRIDPGGDERSLGSIDYLAIVFVLQYHLPLTGKIHPYAGVGFNYNRYYEKSGIINELGVPDSYGLTGQLGVNFDILSYMTVNIDFRANQTETELIDNGRQVARLDINASALSLGLGFRF